MANSIKEYKYNAGIGPSSPTYTAPDYLDGRALTDIQVWVGDEHHMISRLGQDTDYSIVGTQVTIDGYSLSDQEYVYIKRVSNPDARLTDYVDGSLLTADTLDADANQIFYLTQEASDEAAKTNMAAGAFYYAGESAPTREVNNETIPPPVGTLWYDMTSSPNVLRIWDGTEWYYATPLKVTLKFTNTSDEYTSNVHLGTNIDFIQTTQYTSKSDVYLNGVKLSLASSAGTIDTDGDYFYNTTTNNLSLLALGADDVITIETFVGGYSTEISALEASVTALIDAFNLKYDDVTPKLDDVIALNIPAQVVAVNNARDAAEDHRDMAKNYASADDDFTNEDGVTSKSAKQYRNETQSQVALAASEADDAAQSANLSLARAQESQDPNAGWVSIDNDTIKTNHNSSSAAVLYTKDDLTLYSDDGNIYLDASHQGVPATGEIIHNGSNKLPHCVGKIDLLSGTWTGYSNVQVQKNGSNYTVVVDDLGSDFGIQTSFMDTTSGTRYGDFVSITTEDNTDQLADSFKLTVSSLAVNGTSISSSSFVSAGTVMVTIYKY
jgi:hypothetical protein